MDLKEVAARGLVMLGCGKMGSAMLAGWLARGVPPESVNVIDPAPSDWLRESGVTLGGGLSKDPAVLLLAVKPQVMASALPAVTHLGGGQTLIVSVAAGIPIATFEAAFGEGTPVVRAMPNLPASVGAGVTAIVGNGAAGAPGLDLADALLSSIGSVVRLADEGQMDAVTAVSGSGPGYLFHAVETLAEAGEAEGLAPDLAMALARATLAGSGALLAEAEDSAAELRQSVTSPGGTTQAGLHVLMAELPDLMRRTVAAAATRSRELGR